MSLESSVNTKWYVSMASPATDNQTGYEALTWTEVKNIANIGAVGPTFNENTFVAVGDGVEQVRKGTKTYGSMTPQMGSTPDDPGQILVIDAVDGANIDTLVSHKVVKGNGAVSYFQGQIFSAPENIGGADDFITIDVNVRITTKPVKVAAP